MASLVDPEVEGSESRSAPVLEPQRIFAISFSVGMHFPHVWISIGTSNPMLPEPHTPPHKLCATEICLSVNNVNTLHRIIQDVPSPSRYLSPFDYTLA